MHRRGRGLSLFKKIKHGNVLALFIPPQKEFRDLFRDRRDDRQTEHHAPFASAERLGIEDRLQEGQIHNQ